jgi:hypothetical protein
MSYLSSQYFSKDSIRERMFRVASNYVGIGRTEMLDPVLCLLLEALGEEIYRVSGEIDNLESRLLENLSAMLVPDIDSIASPAHTVLHAASSDGVQTISTRTAFSHSGLSFYPLCNARIYGGDVRYFAHDGYLYKVLGDQSRIVQSVSGKKNAGQSHTFWIGLALDKEIENLAGMSFYFNFQNIEDKERYAGFLPYTQWKVGSQHLVLTKGLFSEKDEYESATQELFAVRRLSDKINTSIKEHYDRYYLTVQDDFDITAQRESLPTALQNSFSANDFKESLLWIEITCPEEIPPEIIHSLQVSMNTFPVVNKRLVTKTVQVNRSLPFIPLHTGKNESFISVHSLSDISGKKYYDVPLGADTNVYGIYSLRRGGCERYGVRDADEFMSDLVGLLEGEAVSLIQQSDYEQRLKEAGENVLRFVKDIKKTMSKKTERYEIENYILVSPENEDEIYFVEYWLTNTTDANGIATGTRFRTTGLAIQSASLVNLLPTSGGQKAPFGIEKQNSYRHSLSKQNLLISHQDIEDFCRREFGHFLSNIQVRRGLLSMPSKKDFVRTIDLYLQPSKEMQKYFGREQVEIVEQLLKNNSPATYRYRIFTN